MCLFYYWLALYCCDCIQAQKNVGQATFNLAYLNFLFELVDDIYCIDEALFLAFEQKTIPLYITT